MSSDDEWNVWQSTWQGGTGPLPDVRQRARKASWRQRADNVAGLVLIATGLTISGWLLHNGGGDAEIGAVDLVFTLAVLLGFVWLQRGLRRDRIGNPRDAIAFLERRLRLERRGSLFAPAAFLITLAALSYESHQAIDDAGGWVQALTGVFLVASTLFMLSVPWLVRRRARRDQLELDQWRQWMDAQGL